MDPALIQDRIKELASKLQEIVDKTPLNQLSTSIKIRVAAKDIQEFCHQLGTAVYIVITKGEKVSFAFYPLDKEIRKAQTEAGRFSRSLNIPLSKN